MVLFVKESPLAAENFRMLCTGAGLWRGCAAGRHRRRRRKGAVHKYNTMHCVVDRMSRLSARCVWWAGGCSVLRVCVGGGEGVLTNMRSLVPPNSTCHSCCR